MSGSKSRWGLVVSTIFFAICLSGAVLWSANNDDRQRPEVTSSHSQYHFGEKSADETVEHVFVLKNEGQLPLEILDIRPDCGCTSVAPPEEAVPPGWSVAIPVKLSLAESRGDISRKILIETNDPATKYVTLRIMGRVIRPSAVAARPESF